MTRKQGDYGWSASFQDVLNLRRRAEAAEAELTTLRAESVRLTDLVRYQRHELRSENLITDEEYAALVADSDGGQRVARLESYDALRASSARVREETLREAAAQANIRVTGDALDSYSLGQERAAELIEKAILALLPTSPEKEQTEGEA